jgi:VanZ family protein
MLPADRTPDLPPPWYLGAAARRGWQLLLALLVVAVAVLAFSPEPPDSIDTGWDKTNHLLAFAALAFSAEGAFWPQVSRRWRNSAALMAYGVFIELVQTQIPGRSGEVPDLLADAAGIALGLLLAAVLLRSWSGAPSR